MANTTVPHTTVSRHVYETPNLVCDVSYMFILCVPQDHSVLVLPMLIHIWDSGPQKPRVLVLSAQYRLLVNYTSPLVSKLKVLYSGVTACIASFVGQSMLSSGKVWRHRLFWFISRKYKVKTNQIPLTTELQLGRYQRECHMYFNS